MSIAGQTNKSALFPALKRIIGETLKTSHILLELKTNSSNLSLWQELKSLVIGKSLAIVICGTFVDFLVKIQLNILAGYNVNNNNPISTKTQENFLSLCQFFISKQVESWTKDELMPKVTKKECDIKIKRDISTKDRISSRPLFSDEWERQRVEVRSSCLAPTDGMNPGEGLFAKSNIKKGAIAALFNGVRQASEKNSFSEYRIKLNGDTDLDIIGHDRDIRIHLQCYSLKSTTREKLYNNINMRYDKISFS